MEGSSDAFSGGVEAPDADPFGEISQPEDPFGADVTDQPVEGVPVVNAEGEQVAPTEVGASEAVQEAADPSGAASAPSAANGAEPDPEAEQDAAAEAEEAAPAKKKDDAPKPAAGTNAKGEVVKRAYRVLTPDGDGKWREVTWFESKDGKMVEEGTGGAKRQRFALVHNKDAALRIGFRALGGPAEGVRLVAVADTLFDVKHVKPEAIPEPRVRVTIS